MTVDLDLYDPARAVFVRFFFPLKTYSFFFLLPFFMGMKSLFAAHTSGVGGCAPHKSFGLLHVFVSSLAFVSPFAYSYQYGHRDTHFVLAVIIE